MSEGEEYILDTSSQGCITFLQIEKVFIDKIGCSDFFLDLRKKIFWIDDWRRPNRCSKSRMYIVWQHMATYNVYCGCYKVTLMNHWSWLVLDYEKAMFNTLVSVSKKTWILQAITFLDLLFWWNSSILCNLHVICF